MVNFKWMCIHILGVKICLRFFQSKVLFILTSHSHLEMNNLWQD